MTKLKCNMKYLAIANGPTKKGTQYIFLVAQQKVKMVKLV